MRSSRRQRDMRRAGPMARRRAAALIASVAVATGLPLSAAAQSGPTPVLVTTSADSGPGSLRQAILDANASAEPNEVVFNIPTSDAGFDGQVFTISPISALPIVRNDLAIDGATQTAFSGDTNPAGPEVVLDGGFTTGAFGISISGDRNAVRNLVVSRFTLGVGASYSVDGTSSDNEITDNYVGTDPTGTSAWPNEYGILVQGFGSAFSQAARNVVSRNLVSGNTGAGITLCDAADSLVTANLVGTDVSGQAALGNGGHGIAIVCAGDPRNQFVENVVAHNGLDGILDEPDYDYPVGYTPDGHRSNSFRRNSIHSNGGLGINLIPPPFGPGDPDGVTANDPDDADEGANLVQNFPVITAVSVGAGGVSVTGTLDSTPGSTFEVELFGNDAIDPSQHGEAQRYLGVVSVTTDGAGDATFTASLPAGSALGSAVTATATDAAGNTSEISRAFAVASSNSTQQTTSVNVVVEPGVLAISLAQSSVSFGDLGPGQSSGPVAVGEITYTNTLGAGSPWSASVAATSLVSGPGVIPFGAITYTPGPDVAPADPPAPSPGSEGSFSGPDPDPGTSFSDPVTLVTAPAGAQGVFAHGGSTATLALPPAAAAGSYSGVFQYTILG